MAGKTGLKDVGLAAVALVAIGTSGYAISSVQQPHPALDDTSGPTPALVTSSPAATSQPTQAVQTATPATPGESGQEAVSVTTAPGPETAPEDLNLDAWWRALDDDGSNLLVLGDGYSNLPEQWIQQRAEIEAEDRPVEIRHWGEAEDVAFNDPIALSEGEGPSLHVWSASRGGTTISDVTERLDTFLGASEDPDSVLITLGLGSGDEDVPSAMDELLAVLPDVPVMLVVWPQGLYDEQVGAALAQWGTDHAGQVLTVDLREVTSPEASAQEWANAFHDARQ